MAKKCIGVREHTGHPCQRPASRGSDFCFACKQQEGNEKIINLQHDVYHCPDDGQKLWYVPKRKMHRCDMCGGVLLNGGVREHLEAFRSRRGGFGGRMSHLWCRQRPIRCGVPPFQFRIGMGIHCTDVKLYRQHLLGSVECWPLQSMRINLVSRPRRA